MDRPKLPKCDHADAVWMPVIVSRWAAHEGTIEQFIPLKYCEACTKIVTHEQLIPDYARSAAMRGIKKKGYPPLSRHLNTIRWERAELFEKKYADQQRRAVHYEDIGPPSDGAGQ